jgi:hypothetical protein
MKIYNHDDSGIFIKATEAKKDPLESAKKGKDVFLIPALATDITPPTVGENEAAVVNGKKWSEVEDYRGQQFYLLDDPEQYKMADIGPLPTGAILGENTPAKEAAETEAAEAAKARNDAIEALWAEFDSATTIAGLKVALKKILGRE